MRMLAAVMTAFLLSPNVALAASCSDYIESCVSKAVAGGTKADAYRPKCVAAAKACKQSGCFVGPTSGVTFACNLDKR